MRVPLLLVTGLLLISCSRYVYQYNPQSQTFSTFRRGQEERISEYQYKLLDARHRIAPAWTKVYDSRTNLVRIDQDGRPVGTMTLNLWAAIVEQPRRSRAPWDRNPKIINRILVELDRGALPRQKDKSVFIQPGHTSRWDKVLGRWEDYDAAGRFAGYWAWDRQSGMWQFFEGGW